jgi:cobalt-zinc-cadmium efflux system outer membrane protein
MRFPLVALALALAAIANPAGAQPAAAPTTLTLNEAMRLAEAAHPSVRAREAQLAAAEGTRSEAAALLFNNPELSTEAIRRRADAPVGSWNEWSVGISQPFETGGQQARRREAAAAGLDALRAEIDDVRRQARVEAATRFLAVLSAQRRVQLEQRSVDLFERSAQAVAKRRAAGEDTRLDANVALVEAERARNALALAGERLIDARSELGTAVRLPPSALPEVAGELGTPSTTPCRTGWSSCSHRRRTCPGSALSRHAKTPPAPGSASSAATATPTSRLVCTPAARARATPENAWRSCRCRCRCPCSSETTPPSARR